MQTKQKKEPKKEKKRSLLSKLLVHTKHISGKLKYLRASALQFQILSFSFLLA